MFRHSGEEKAWLYLQTQGHQLLEHNYRTPDRRTEIDLITLKGDVVHFIEVKDWKSGIPILTQNRKRQAMVRRAASIYLASQRFHNAIMSFREDSSETVQRAGGGLVVIGEDGVSREDLDECDTGYELCRTDSASGLDSGLYSVSFDLISIMDGRIEYVERLF